MRWAFGGICAWGFSLDRNGRTGIAGRRGDGAGECARRGVADKEPDDEDALPTL
jgi:hypothetical protein